MANAKVVVNIDLKGVENKFSQKQFSFGKIAMANQMLLDMNKFVPRKKGDLRASGHVIKNGNAIEWTTLYARSQFFGTNGKVIYKKYTTTGTGKRWDLVASNQNMEKWKKVFLKGANFIE